MAGALITCFIGGTHCLMDPDELEKREGGHDNENETCAWVEYWLDGELVHRSVDMRLKKAIFADAIAADF